MKMIANDYENKEVIKIIREWTELTQAELADSIHLSNRTIEGYEQGRSNFTFATFMEICKIHGITVTLEKKK